MCWAAVAPPASKQIGWQLPMCVALRACRPAEELVAEVGRLLAGSSHSGLLLILDPLLLPLLAGVLRGTAQLRGGSHAAPPGALPGEAERADMAARGHAWALLGAARLHLARPPPGGGPGRQARAQARAPAARAGRGRRAGAGGGRSDSSCWWQSRAPEPDNSAKLCAAAGEVCCVCTEG